jgi:hypothetical protein
MLMLTQIKPKVFCSACSAMFRSTGTQQVVDFKGFFTTFSMFVPMFHNIYKSTRVLKTLYNVQWFGVVWSDALSLRRLKHGTLEQE